MDAGWSFVPLSEFPSVAESWDALNESNQGQASLCATFVGTVAKHFLNGHDLIAVYRDEHGIGAMGVLRRASAWRWTTAQPSQAPIGLWLSRRGALSPDLLGSLRRALPGRPILIDLLQLDSASHETPEARPLRPSHYITTSKLLVPSNFDDYFAGLGKNLRQSYRKSVNRLTKLGIAPTLTIVTEPGRVTAGVAAYGELESQGWKASLGTAIHAENAQGRFYDELMETFALKGMAEVWEYRFDDRLVAVDLCIKRGEVLTILKTTFDESEARYSPSIMMKLDALREHVVRGDIREIEFFGRILEWHRRLNSVPRDMFHLTWCRYPALYSLNEFRAKTMSRLRAARGADNDSTHA